MKSKKIITLTIVVLLIIAVAVTSMVLAGEKSTNQGIEEKDRTSVVLVPEQTESGIYTGKVDVYLEMDDGMLIEEEDKNEENEDVIIKDAASVASFQIRLKIYAMDENIDSKIKFDYDSKLQENETNKTKNGVELARQTKNPITETTTLEDGTEKTNIIGENLNLYFVGTQELNDVDSKEPLKVGTITLNKNEFGDNSSISILPDGTNENGNPVTVAASIGHNTTNIVVDEIEDRTDFILNPKDESQDKEPDIDDGDGDGDGENESGDHGDTGDEGNSGNTGDTDNGDNNDDSDNSGWETDQNTGNNGDNSTSGKSTNKNKQSIINKIKTGANRSLFGIIILLTILIVMAIVIIFAKIRIDKRNSKK